MADVEVLGADVADGRVKTLKVRFKHTAERTIDRETAVAWLADGHSLFTWAGSSHHGTRGKALQLVEVEEQPYLRTDTQPVAKDDLVFPASHGH
jgi:hypothetical protein